jgi:DNA-binding GntR family transcriptional regulator
MSRSQPTPLSSANQAQPMQLTGGAPQRRAVTAQEAALAGLRDWLQSGDLVPSSRIDQREAAAMLGCSIVPLREALKTLEAEGQVTYVPQRGYFVTELDADELLETYRIRELLEDEAVRRAVPRVNDATLDAMRAFLDDGTQGADRGDVRAVMAANRAFHFALYDRSGMPRLVRLIRTLWDLTDRYRTVYNLDPRRRRAVLGEHAAIIDAVAQGDAEKVVTLLRTHRQHTVHALADAPD